MILWELTNTNEIVDPFDVTILTYPNPSMDEVFIASKKDYVIRGIGIYDMKGSLVDQHNDINDYYFHLPVDQLIPGPYILKFQFDYGIAARQIIVK